MPAVAGSGLQVLLRAAASASCARRKLRVLLTAAGIVLGVGMICGVLLLAATIQRTFTDLYDSVYGQTDLVVSGSESAGSLPLSALRARAADRGGRGGERQHLRGHLAGRRGRAGRGGERLDPERVGRRPARDRLHRLDHDRRAARSRAGARSSSSRAGPRRTGSRSGTPIELAAPDGVIELEVVGLFRFSSGLDFGGEGFASMPLATARRAFDKPDVFDEVEVRRRRRRRGQRSTRSSDRLEREFGKGVEVATPQAKGEDIQHQLQALQRRPLLLRRHGAVRRRLPDLQQLQHDRAPAHARDRHAADARRHAADDRPLRPAGGAAAGRWSARRSASGWGCCWRWG